MSSTFDQSLTRRSKAIFGAVGAIVIAVGALAAFVGAVQTHPGATYYTASFGRAGQGLDPHSDVKIRGITVGGVDSVGLDRQGRAKVRIRIDNGIKIPTTAVASIEPVSVFGPKDLVLDLGAGEGAGPYLRDGTAITKTKDPQELADVAYPAYRLTSSIDPQELYTILHTFAEGLDGKGTQLRRTIDNSNTLITMAYNNRAYIQLLLRDFEGLSDTFGPRGDRIVGIARDVNDLSPVLTDRPDKITKLLDGSSRLADTVSRTMERQGDQTATILDDSGKAIHVVFSERGRLPILMDGLIQFFGLIDAIVDREGPKGTLLASQLAYINVAPCDVLVGICGTAPLPSVPAVPAKGAGR
jgi:phospholipid/cholesterol/gamma-HCH transport system substrate-binding protein